MGTRQLEALVMSISVNAEGAIKGLKKFSRETNSIGSSAKAVGADLSAGLTAPLVAAGGAALAFESDYESVMAKIAGSTDWPQEQLGSLRTRVLELAPAVGELPAEFGRATDRVASLGIVGEEAFDIVEQAAKLAAGQVGDTTSNARIAAKAMRVFRDDGLKASQIMDILAAATRKGELETSQLAPALSRVSGAAAQLGIPFAEVAGTLSAMSISLNSVQDAGTSLDGIFNSLLKNGEGLSRDALAKINTSFEELKAQIKEKGLGQAMIDLDQALQDNGMTMANVFRDASALKGEFSLVGKNAKDTIQIMRDVADSTGAADRAYKANAETLKHQWSIAVATSAATMTTLGEDLKRDAIPILKDLTSAVSWAGKSWGSLDADTRQYIIRIGAVAAAAGPAIWGLGQLATSVGSVGTLVTKVIPYLMKLGPVFGGATTAAATLATTLGPAGILAIGLVAFSTDWSALFDGMAREFEAFTSTIDRGMESLVDSFGGRDTWEAFWDEFVPTPETVQMGPKMKALRDETGHLIEKEVKPRVKQAAGDAGQAAGKSLADGMTKALDPADQGKRLADAINESVRQGLGDPAIPMQLEEIGGQYSLALTGPFSTLATEMQGTMDYTLELGRMTGEGLYQEQLQRLSMMSVAADEASNRNAQGTLKRLKDTADKSTALTAATTEKQKGLWDGFGQEIKNDLSGSFRSAYDTIRSGSNVFDGVLTGAKGFVGRMLDTMDAQLEAQAAAGISMAIASAPFTFGASLASVAKIGASLAAAKFALGTAKSKIAGLADGGRVLSSGAVWVGERGPELMWPGRGAVVEPLPRGGLGRSSMIQFIVDGRLMAEAVVPHWSETVQVYAS